jgi:hypothetical protein
MRLENDKFEVFFERFHEAFTHDRTSIAVNADGQMTLTAWCIYNDTQISCTFKLFVYKESDFSERLGKLVFHLVSLVNQVGKY